MAKDETKKRVSLYFNLEDPDEALMYQYLDARKKSQYIKNLILNDIKGNKNIQVIQYEQQPNEEEAIDDLTDCDLDSNSAIDFDD